MPRGLARGAFWLACLLPACGYNPKYPSSFDAKPGVDTNTGNPDSAVAGDVLLDTGTAKDTVPILDSGITTEALGPAPEVSPPEVSAPAPDTSPVPVDTSQVTEPDASVRLDARVFEDVSRIADRPQDLPPDNPLLPPDTAVPSSDTYRTCGAPPENPNGQIEYTVPINVGSVATYTCNPGYRPTSDGSAELKRTCRADGTWDGPAFECAPVNCGTPPTVTNGNAPLFTTTTYKSTATYSCLDKYVLSTADPATCLDTGVWGPLPTCARQQYTLTVTKTGTGTVTDATTGIDCGTTCTVKLDVGTTVSLTAAPGADQTFIEWGTSLCSGRGTCSFTLTANTTVSPYFSPPPNIMFVTSTAQSTNLGGLAGADTLCTQKAHAAGLAGNYKAWLSTATASAASRMGTASGWVRPDGKPVLNRIGDIATNKLIYPPRLDENGADLGYVFVMTATLGSGILNSNLSGTTCNDYTSTASATINGGIASASNDSFTWAQQLNCQDLQRIYCLGVDRTALHLPPTPVSGRYAFTTKSAWFSGNGIASADAFCQTEASQVGLPGTYKALLAANGKSAASRFNTSGLPWIRADGIPLTPTASGFFSATLLDVAPNLSADGTVSSGGQSWSGAVTMDTAGTNATTCLDWQSNAPTDASRAGAAGVSATSRFFGYWQVSCEMGYLLTCLQE